MKRRILCMVLSIAILFTSIDMPVLAVVLEEILETVSGNTVEEDVDDEVEKIERVENDTELSFGDGGDSNTESASDNELKNENTALDTDGKLDGNEEILAGNEIKDSEETVSDNGIGDIKETVSENDLDNNKLSISENHIQLMDVSIDEQKIQIGDYIKLGTYYGEDILWRCVDVDEKGPLMLSDKVLCLKAYDAKGNSGYHYVSGKFSDIRKQYGSNCYSDSNIREWLNSREKEVAWTHDTPIRENLYNAYSSEGGFLNPKNFSRDEFQCIKTVNQKIYTNEAEKVRGLIAGGYREHSADITGVSIIQQDYNFEGCYYQNVTDKIFIPTFSHIKKVYDDLGGEEYIKAKPTEEAVNYSDYKNANLNVESNCEYWVNHAGTMGYSYEYTCIVMSNGKIANVPSYQGNIGVRPAFYLDDENWNYDYGDGSRENPYYFETVREEVEEKEFKIGEYIILGTYYGEDILWRCVDVDENGPLMLSDKILCLKAFDAKGNSNYHYVPGIFGDVRKSYGSNCYKDSNLRQWLNSEESVIGWTHDAPTKSNVVNGYNAYAEEAGFLSSENFKETELQCIKEVTQRIYTNDAEYARGVIDGGSRRHELVQGNLTVQDYNFNDCYYQNVTDKVFIPTLSHLKKTYDNVDFGAYVRAEPAESAVENSEYKNSNFNVGRAYEYWVNHGCTTGFCYEHTCTLPANGVLSGSQSYNGAIGVRTAFYLDLEVWNPNGGDGSEENPYYIHVSDAGDTSKSHFNVFKYRADKLQDDENPEAKSLQFYFDEIETPSHIMVDVLQENGAANWIEAWELVTDVFEAVDDISKVYDLAIEEKDIYAAVILDSLEAACEYEVVNTCDTVIKDSKDILGQVKDWAKIKYSIDILDANNFKKLTVSQKRELQDLTEAFFEKDFDKDLSSLNDVFKNFDTILKGADCIETYLEKIASTIALANMCESMKEVLRCLYQECPTDNLSMRMALLDCITIINSSTKELIQKIVMDEIEVVGIGMAQYLVRELWDEVKLTLNIGFPTLDIILAGYKLGKFLSNSLFKTDETAEQYHNMLAVLEYEKLTKQAYYVLGEKYKKDNTENSAINYLTAIDYVFTILDMNCIKAYNYVEGIDSAIVRKIINIFDEEGQNSREELKSIIANIQREYFLAHESINVAWIEYLPEDYPEQDYYEKYSPLFDASIKRIMNKEFLIRCPVDIYIYDSANNLVASIVNNEPQCNGNLTVAVKRDAKIVQFYGDEKYTLKCVGNDSGTMDITIIEYKDDVEIRNVEYYDLSLQNGKSYETQVSTETMDITEYRFVQDGDTYINPNFDSMIEKGNKYNAVINAGTFNTEEGTVTELEAYSDENIKINAYIPEGKSFVQWTSNVGNNIFENPNDSTTQIRMPAKDVIITAILKDENDNILVTDVYLDKNSIEMRVGEKVQLKAIVTPSNAANTSIIWESKDGNVVKIDADGVLQATSEGTTEIIAASTDGKCKAMCVVEVIKNNKDNENFENQGKDNNSGNYENLSRDNTKKEPVSMNKITEIDNTDDFSSNDQDFVDKFLFKNNKKEIEDVFKPIKSDNENEHPNIIPSFENNESDVDGAKTELQEEAYQENIYLIIFCIVCLGLIFIALYKKNKYKNN